MLQLAVGRQMQWWGWECREVRKQVRRHRVVGWWMARRCQEGKGWLAAAMQHRRDICRVWEWRGHVHLPHWWICLPLLGPDVLGSSSEWGAWCQGCRRSLPSRMQALPCRLVCRPLLLQHLGSLPVLVVPP